MAASPEFIEFANELFAPLGGLTIRRMFGGAGIYSRGIMFGLIVDDTIYLKADGESMKAFQERGCGPFVYDGKGKPIQMSYWQMPAELDVARAGKAATPPPSRRMAAGARRRR
jgi:DNA transformation protein and related proteins